jgi:hypothetical protein
MVVLETLSAVGPFEAFPALSPEIMKIAKGSGIFTIVGTMVFLIIRFKLVEIVSIEQETVAVRLIWGKPKYNHRWSAQFIDWCLGNIVLATPVLVFLTRRSCRASNQIDRLGRLVVLKPGAHKVFRGWQGLVVVNLR